MIRLKKYFLATKTKQYMYNNGTNYIPTVYKLLVRLFSIIRRIVLMAINGLGYTYSQC